MAYRKPTAEHILENAKRKHHVEELAAQIINIVRAERGITLDALRLRFPADGPTQWDVSGTIDSVTGYTSIGGRVMGCNVVEIQRGKHGERHLVIRAKNDKSEFVVRHAIDLMAWV